MGKPRKGKKGKKDEDFSDDDKAVDLFALGAKADEDGEDDDVGVAVSRKNKKKNDRMVSNFAALSMEDNEEEELEEEIVVSEPKKAGNAFAFDMLDMMDEGGSDGGNQSDQQEPKPAPKPQPSAPQPSKKGRKREKKGKNAGKNKQEEDIDAILAEIEGQGNLEVAAPTAEDNKGLDLGDLSEMTDEQLATLMGIDDTEGESKKERRKNKKKRGKANDTAAEEVTPVVDGAEAEEDAEDGGVSTSPFQNYYW